MSTIRAVINDEYEKRLESLGRLLGHTSISQTINFLLEKHLETETEAAKKYLRPE